MPWLVYDQGTMKTKKPFSPSAPIITNTPVVAVPEMQVGDGAAIPEAVRASLKEAQAAVELAQRELGGRAFQALQADTQMRQAAQALEQRQAALIELSKKTLTEMGLNTEDQNWNLDFTSFEAKRIA